MSQQRPERIQELDFLRGLAMLALLFFHGSYYWNSGMTAQQMNQWLQRPVSEIALFFAKFAGIFAMISGVANGISITYRLDNKNNKAWTIFCSSFITGLWITLLGRLHSSLLEHPIIGDLSHPYPDGPTQYSLIVGSIMTGKLQIPSDFILIFRNTALFVIGMSVIFSSFLLLLLGRNHDHNKNKIRNNMIILAVIATLIILATQPAKMFLRPKWVEAALNKKYVSGYLLGWLIGDSYPFFPYAGYALYGTIFGMAFYYKIEKKIIITIGTVSGVAYVVAGTILLSLYGPPNISAAFQTLPIQWNLMHVGAMLLIMSFIYYVHYLPEGSKIQKILTAKFVRRFGLLTLTIFIMEGIIGETIKALILDKLFPGWSSSIVLAFIYGILLILLWLGILVLWEKANFVGTWEWITAKIIAILTFREPTRLKIKENLNLP